MDDDQYQNQRKEDKENDIPGWCEDKDYFGINFHNGTYAIPCTLTLKLNYAFLDHYNLTPNNAPPEPRDCIHEIHEVRCLRTNK